MTKHALVPRMKTRLKAMHRLRLYVTHAQQAGSTAINTSTTIGVWEDA